MKNLESMIKVAQEKGMPYEVATIIADRHGDKLVFPFTEVCIKTHGEMWNYWHITIMDPGTEDQYEMWSYKGQHNWTNGKTQKTWNKEYNALKKLEQYDD